MHAAGITCSQRLGDLLATLDPGSEAERRRAARRQAAVTIPLPPGSRTSSTPPATAPRIEALLPAGVRHRQLRVRTLLLGMMLTLADRRPAHLTEVHAALTALPARDQRRLGVTEDWKTGPHQLTYRQAERTFSLITAALAKDTPDGTPSAALTAVLDDLLEASIPPEHKNASTASPRTGPTWSPSPAPRATAAATAPTPRRPGDTATPTSPAPKARCSSATTSPPPP